MFNSNQDLKMKSGMFHRLNIRLYVQLFEQANTPNLTHGQTPKGNHRLPATAAGILGGSLRTFLKDRPSW